MRKQLFGMNLFINLFFLLSQGRRQQEARRVERSLQDRSERQRPQGCRLQLCGCDRMGRRERGSLLPQGLHQEEQEID